MTAINNENMINVFWLLHSEVGILEKIIKDNDSGCTLEELEREYRPMIDDYKTAANILKEKDPMGYHIFKRAYKGKVNI